MLTTTPRSQLAGERCKSLFNDAMGYSPYSAFLWVEKRITRAGMELCYAGDCEGVGPLAISCSVVRAKAGIYIVQ